MTPFLPPRREVIPSNGPLILFTDNFDVIIFSPLDHFYVSLIDFRDGQIEYGIEGEVEEIPAGTTHRFILAKGKGINATIEYWGEQMRLAADRARPDRYADAGLSYLGYWTDNGAAYYYHHEPGMTEEETLLAVKADADERGIPYGYFQIDSWWYFKEPGFITPGGLIRWEPQPQMFPDGLAAFQQRLGLPLVAHNRWFATENDYLADYEFVVEKSMALPLHRDMFDHFAADAASWGIATYEQDWLMSQVTGLQYLRNGIDHADAWIKNMDDAMADRGLTMQICMPGAAHLMDAINRRSWTTSRTSIDYRAGISKESYWPQFHTINMLAYALGVWPFKDNFRTVEKFAEAEALIATLSAGMVGNSDFLGLSDADLLARTCRADGLLLKPDRPAFPIDAMFLDHQRPYLATTYSRREGLGRWTYLAAYHLARRHPERSILDKLWGPISYSGLDPGRMFVFPDHVTDWRVNFIRDLGRGGPLVVYDWRTGEAWAADDGFDLPVREHLYDFDYFVLAPIFHNGLALIGEMAKYVTLADKRFASIETLDDGFRVRLLGAPGEVVTLAVFDADAGAMLKPFRVTIGGGGEAEADLVR